MAGRPDDFPRIEDFLQLLARAVRQFHTYPATSPLCTDAIAACHKALGALDRRDRLAMRVTPTELIIDNVGTGAGTIVAEELVHRLHRARVIALDIDRAASARHLSHFCATIVRAETPRAAKSTFADLLLETGVDTIVATLAHRPEVVDVGAPRPSVCVLIDHEQQRRQQAFAAAGPVDYLYPPDKGWVRLDPASRLDIVSLVDLALLVDNPTEVATILLRLTDDEPAGEEERKKALERKFSDVVTLFASLDPKLARVMFSKLARAVLDLDPTRRTDLLRRTILPGLLDGRADGAVLHDFPDVDLADSLCLLLELETAAPEVLTAALNRLDMSPERRQTVIPLIDSRLRADKPSDKPEGRELDRLAERLVQVDGAGKDFSEFAAFDLSIDERAAGAIAAARDAIAATDLPGAQLGCLANLVRLEPNPTLVGAFLRRAMALFDTLERADRWLDLADWMSNFSQIAASLQEARPDVADAIVKSFEAFQAVPRTAALVDHYQGGLERRRIAHALVDALGTAAIPGLLGLLDDPAQQTRASAAISLMSDHAPLLAPALALKLGGASSNAARAIVRTLGSAGANYEAPIGEQLEHVDEQVVREALRALAKIGTPKAAALVVHQIQNGTDKRRTAAEEALWHFPASRTAAQVRQLLGDRHFVVQHPDAASRLLARVAHSDTAGLDAVLAELEPLRFRFWNPSVVKVALKARELRTR